MFSLFNRICISCENFTRITSFYVGYSNLGAVYMIPVSRDSMKREVVFMYGNELLFMFQPKFAYSRSGSLVKAGNNFVRVIYCYHIFLLLNMPRRAKIKGLTLL